MTATTMHSLTLRPTSAAMGIRRATVSLSARACCRALPAAAIPMKGLLTQHTPLFTPTSSVRRIGFSPCQLSSGDRRVVLVAGQARADALHLPLDRDLEEPLPGFDRISDSLKALADGKFVVVLDDENRENEGDLIMNADKVTTEAMAFMVEHTSGVICIGMEGKDLDRLRLPLMISSAENEDTMYTAFTITVDLRDGITTGISASDRAKTLLKLADPTTRPEQLRRPGHIFPLRARPGGVLARPGHTEAGVDLARLSGSFPAGALCEIVSKADGSMARTPELQSFARQYGLPCITIADLMRYRLRHESLVSLTASAELTTPRYGNVQVHTFKSSLDGAEHVAVISGNVKGEVDVPLHIQWESCLASLLDAAPPQATSSSQAAVPTLASNDLQQLALENGQEGVLIFMRQAQGSSLAAELQQLAGATAASAAAPLDLCDYGLVTQMLAALGVGSVTMSSNCLDQITALKCCGVQVSSMNAPTSASSHAVKNGSAAPNGHVLAVAL